VPVGDGLMVGVTDGVGVSGGVSGSGSVVCVAAISTVCVATRPAGVSAGNCAGEQACRSRANRSRADREKLTLFQTIKSTGFSLVF
jgi:hypothetical protein